MCFKVAKYKGLNTNFFWFLYKREDIQVVETTDCFPCQDWRLVLKCVLLGDSRCTCTCSGGQVLDILVLLGEGQERALDSGFGLCHHDWLPEECYKSELVTRKKSSKIYRERAEEEERVLPFPCLPVPSFIKLPCFPLAICTCQGLSRKQMAYSS